MKFEIVNVKLKTTFLAAAVVALIGCKSTSYLESDTTPDRAGYGASAIDVPPAAERRAILNPAPEKTDPIVVQEITGTWIFTTPPTVTRVQKRTVNSDQITLYKGRPEPADRPFAVITVSHDRSSTAAGDPATYKVSNHREYVMNGGIVQEWTGLTDTGAGFCEMVVRRPGTAGETDDVCHALALARTDEEQKLALSILGSIVWKPSR